MKKNIESWQNVWKKNRNNTNERYINIKEQNKMIVLKHDSYREMKVKTMYMLNHDREQIKRVKEMNMFNHKTKKMNQIDEHVAW